MGDKFKMPTIIDCAEALEKLSNTKRELENIAESIDIFIQALLKAARK